MLIYRILTAIVLITLVLWAIFAAQQIVFIGFCTLIIILSAWEWAGLTGWNKWWQRLLYTMTMLVVLAILGLTTPYMIVIAIATLWWFVVFVGLFCLRKKSNLIQLPKWLIASFGFLVLIPCWDALIMLHHNDPRLLLFMFVIIWLADIAAYFGGRRFGKTPLAAAISPKKTIEGAWVGIFIAVVFGIAIQMLLGKSGVILFYWFAVIFPVIIFSIVGDLFESAIKRLQGLKDSGRLLPGHGGLLDRIDSLTAAAPVFVCGLAAMGFL